MKVRAQRLRLSKINCLPCGYSIRDEPWLKLSSERQASGYLSCHPPPNVLSAPYSPHTHGLYIEGRMRGAEPVQRPSTEKRRPESRHDDDLEAKFGKHFVNFFKTLASSSRAKSFYHPRQCQAFKVRRIYLGAIRPLSNNDGSLCKAPRQKI